VKLPNYDQATIPKAKITDYLLSTTHRDGRSKAMFFTRYGFSVEAWQLLAQALLNHAAYNLITKIENSPFGERYIVEGSILAPDGRTPFIRSVWFIDDGDITPKFVTAYPLQRRTR
jgi:hypothetical protein